MHRVLTSAPNDTSGLEQLISTRALEPDKLVALLGKTEGNGCVNDFTRAFSVSALGQSLGEYAQGVRMVMSGGTEGGLSPHLVAFEVLDLDGPGPAGIPGDRAQP